MSTVKSIKRVEQAETDIAVLQVEVKNLHEKIDDMKVELSEMYDTIVKNNTQTQELIKQVQEENEQGHRALGEKVSSLERIKWMLMGAAAVVGATGVEAIKMFISHLS